MPVEDFIVVRYSFSGAEIQRVTAGDPDYMITPATAHGGYSGYSGGRYLINTGSSHSHSFSALLLSGGQNRNNGGIE